MAVVSTSMASPVTTPNSVVSTQFSALHCSCLKLDTTLSTQSSSFQHADSHSRLSSSRHGSRGVVSMAASGKIFIGGNWKCAGFKGSKLQLHTRKFFRISSSLPETVISVAIAATIVGGATTLLLKRTKESEKSQTPVKICEACSGSGICPECKGEGFVLQRLSEASSEKARMTSKNAATRYTSGLPRKWSYCTKCSSARSCNTCGGSGRLSL